MRRDKRIGFMNIYYQITFTLFVMVMAANSQSDIFLTSENLNSALKKMQRLQLKIQDNKSVDKDQTFYLLGVEADTLAKLLTDEVSAHGAENESLINLALDRAGDINVMIKWFGRNKRFFYNADAFKQYLDISPNGENAAESNFRVIEWEFYLSETTGLDSLLKASQKKQDFLQRFPDFGNKSEVGLYLAIDYRDLWRHYRKSGDNDTANQYQEITRQQISNIAEKYQDTETGDIAGRLLERFQRELEQEVIP